MNTFKWSFWAASLIVLGTQALGTVAI